ncbi:MAG: ABC transporter permease [Myxococcales bacterium]|jgi:putative ABC transport system permease protein
MRIGRAISELVEGLRIGLGALAGNRLRTLLTTLDIVIGVMTVIAIVAIVQGLNKSFAEQVAGLGASTLYVSKHQWLSMGDDWWTRRNRAPIGRKELRAIQEGSQLARAVAPQIGGRVTVSGNGHELTRVSISGTNSQYLETGAGNLRAGRFLVEADVDFSRTAVVLGADVADQIFPDVEPEEILGARVRIEGRSFTVQGVMERRGSFLGQSMDNNVIIPWTTFQRLLGSRRSIQIAVVGKPEELSKLEDELVGILRRVRRVAPGKPDDFSINRQEQFLKVYRQLTGALYGVAIGVGLITLVVGGIGIMNIMLVSVHERTREIGLRRALGARKRTIMVQFLIESSAVAAVGGAIGTGLGLAVAQFVALVSPLAAAVTPSAVALGFGFSAIVGLVFGSWPAWRAANLDPVEALRWE